MRKSLLYPILSLVSAFSILFGGWAPFTYSGETGACSCALSHAAEIDGSHPGSGHDRTASCCCSGAGSISPSVVRTGKGISPYFSSQHVTCQSRSQSADWSASSPPPSASGQLGQPCCAGRGQIPEDILSRVILPQPSRSDDRPGEGLSVFYLPGLPGREGKNAPGAGSHADRGVRARTLYIKNLSLLI